METRGSRIVLALVTLVLMAGLALGPIAIGIGGNVAVLQAAPSTTYSAPSGLLVLPIGGGDSGT